MCSYSKKYNSLHPSRETKQQSWSLSAVPLRVKNSRVLDIPGSAGGIGTQRSER